MTLFYELEELYLQAGSQFTLDDAQLLQLIWISLSNKLLDLSKGTISNLRVHQSQAPELLQLIGSNKDGFSSGIR